MSKMISVKTGTALRRPGRIEKIRAAAAAWTILAILAVVAVPVIILMMLLTGLLSWGIRVKKRLERRKKEKRRENL